MSSSRPSSSIAGTLSQTTLWLMSLACGVCVANIYYNQPLLGDFAAYFHATPSQVGWVATASQTGYGIGLLFFLPLGDIVERRKLIFGLIYICAGFLALTTVTPTLFLLVVSSLFMGATSMSAQILIPLAVELSPADRRGRTVGVMMTGVLGGILLARTFAGFIGDRFGWRMVYGLATAMMLVIPWLLRTRLPRGQPAVKMAYGRLLLSLWDVWRTQPRLWRPAMISALTFGSFTAFWTCLSFLMMAEFRRGATETGLFGVVGLVGAMVAPFTGKLADRRGPAFTVILALVTVLASFSVMWVWVTIPALIVGVLLMDLGVQSVQVAEQGTVLSLLPEARSRLNTLYMVARFAGGAVGSLIGVTAWSLGKWPAVCASALLLNGLALVLHLFLHRQESTRGQAIEVTAR